MGLSLLATTDAQIVRMVEALYNQRPGYTYLSNFQNFVTQNSVDDFANSLAGNFASSTDAELAATVTSNLGLTGDALTAGNAYLEAQFAANSAARGKVILDAMNALSGLEGDATYGAAATLFNADVTASLVYSQVAANTTVTTSDAAADTTGTAFTLTTSIDNGSAFTGTSIDDTFAATHLTFNASDSLVGGAGTDTLTIVDTGTAALTLPAATVSGIENINIRNLNTSTAVAAVTAVTAVAQVVTITAQGATATTDDVTVTYGTLTQVVGTSSQTASAQATILTAVINGLAGATVAVATGAAIVVTAPVAGTALPFIGFSAMTVIAEAPTIVYTTDNVVAVTGVTAVLATTSQTDTVDATKFTDATTLASDNSTGLVNFTGLTAAQEATMNAGLGGMGAAFGATVTAGTVNISGGTTAGDVVITGAALTTETINSTGKANIIGALTAAATTTALTLNATTGLTTTGALDAGVAAAVTVNATGAVTLASLATTSAAATLTVTGAGATTVTAALDTGITVVDAPANTGGVTLTGSSLVTAVTTLSAGDDSYTTAAVLTTGSVTAGAGTDTLVLGTNVGHANSTLLAAKYTGFEALSVDGAYNLALLGTDLAAVTITGNSALTGMTATQAANVTVAADSAATSFALAGATGTADVLSLSMGTGLLATEATDFTAAVTVTGFETLNISTNAGPTAAAGTTGRTTDFSHAFVGATLSAVNLTGTAFNITDVATTVAATFDGSALTGDGATVSTGLTVAGSAFAGSTITGSAVHDAFTIGAEGSTYNGNAGDDSFTTTAAISLADGTTDVVLAGGAGTDTLTISTAAATLIDSNFINVSGMEKLVTAGTGATSITVGSAFNAAYASVGATLTTGALADESSYAYVGGLSSVATTLTVSGGNLVGNGATEDITITTGTGADAVTVTAGAFVGHATTGATISVNTGAGDDTISITTGTLLHTTNGANAMAIDAGAGADAITVVKVGSADTIEAAATYTINSGDSVLATRDTITGFDIATSGLFSDILDFDGTGAVGTLATSTDSGVILSHSITAGVATFDDVATYAAELIINSTNLTDVIAYLAANTANLDVVAFEYDSTANGVNDATMVYSNSAVDNTVELVGITGATALLATAGHASTALAISIA